MAEGDRNTATRIYCFDRFRLDLDRGTLFVPSGSEVYLRAKSFALLKLFVQNPGRLLNHDEIMEALWPGVLVTDDSIAQCVKDIRRALHDANRHLVSTIPKRGYRFDARVSFETAPLELPQSASVELDSSVPDKSAAPECELLEASADLHEARTTSALQEWRRTVQCKSLPPVSQAGLDARASVAVLPFRIDGVPASDAYFYHGIIEGIIHVLAGLGGLFVTSLGSTLRYVDVAIDPRLVGQELGVHYVLHGSVRRHNDQLRVYTELNDAEAGTVIRSDRYEGRVNDVFQFQDQISLKVATTIAPYIHRRELMRAKRKPPKNMNAYELVLQGLDHTQRLDARSFSQGLEYLRLAVVEDSGYAPAYSYIAWWYALRIAQGWSSDPAWDSAEATRAALVAIEQDPGDALALAVRAYVLAYTQREFAAAMPLFERALSASSNCALAWAFSSVTCSWLGDGPSAILRAEQGIRLSPFDPFLFLHEDFLAMAHYVSGDFDAAIAWARSAALENPRHVPTFRVLVASLVALGNSEHARKVAKRMLEIQPDFALSSFALRTPMSGKLGDVFIDRLRQAGLPE